MLSGVRSEIAPVLLPAECTVETSEGKVGLDRDEAQLATTAVALQARGVEAPDTSGIYEAVFQRLAGGSPEDAAPTLSCRGAAANDLPKQQLGVTGLTPRAEKVRGAMTEVFGDQSLGGFAPGGIGQGHGADSRDYDGRAIDVFYRPVADENRREGWILPNGSSPMPIAWTSSTSSSTTGSGAYTARAGHGTTTTHLSPATRSCVTSTMCTWMCWAEVLTEVKAGLIPSSAKRHRSSSRVGHRPGRAEGAHPSPRLI